MSDSVCWQLSATTAQLLTPRLRGAIDLQAPAAGLRDLQLADQPLTGLTLLGVPLAGDRPTATVVDHYIRGRDLVASYAPTTAERLHPQIYWRVLDTHELPEGACGLELIVSMRTDLLDSHPRLTTTSQLPAGELLSAGDLPPGLFLARPSGASYSYVEMLHPSDYAASPDKGGKEVNAKGMQLHFSLFPERLEKGVIRQSRLQAIFVPRASDLADAQAAQRRFAATPPPLTV